MATQSTAPPPVIPLASAEGEALLAACVPADRAAHDKLWPGYAQQRGRTMCGAASVAMTMRALYSTPIDEDEALSRQRGVSADKVRRGGMTLLELEAFAGSLGLQATRIHVVEPAAEANAADTVGASAAEAALLRAFREAGRFVVLNYHMTTMGQPPFGGHFSPVSAFHAPTRRFLVLDTWPDTEPFWCEADSLVRAAAATDGESGRSRGWLTLTLPAQVPDNLQ